MLAPLGEKPRPGWAARCCAAKKKNRPYPIFFPQFKTLREQLCIDPGGSEWFSPRKLCSVSDGLTKLKEGWNDQI